MLAAFKIEGKGAWALGLGGAMSIGLACGASISASPKARFDISRGGAEPEAEKTPP